MNNEYTGYLDTLLDAPDPDARNKTKGILFTADDLANWKTEDIEHSTEWRRVPGRKFQTEDGIKIEGNFNKVYAIDSLSEDDPRFWVPLTTLGLTDSRLPIDANKYPIIEVTYRCTSEHAHPTWMWTYEGGSLFGALPKSQEWHTVARNVQHFGFPARIDNIIFRLYSPKRSVESFEIKSVLFRTMTKEEKRATDADLKVIQSRKFDTPYPVLKEFMPLGVYMDYDSSKRLADMLQITEDEYWDFVMEDLVTHDHNAIALAHVDNLNPQEWQGLLNRCGQNGIKLLPRHEYPLEGNPEEQKRILETSIAPYADSNAILGHSFSGEPDENDFQSILNAKDAIEAVDPNHPVCLITRYPNSYALFAPFFAASGVGHFATQRPWDAGKMVRTHVPMSNAQQFWVAAATFMYPTQTPAWSTSPAMRLQSNLAFANGARGWFAYSYHNDPVWLRGRVQRTLTGPFLTFSDLWSELGQRMRWADALAPLYLETRIEDAMDDWFVQGISTDTTFLPAPGIAPISQFHLRGNDFSLYITVSNNLREMASVNINIPADAAPGQEMYDLSEYVTYQTWQPMARQRHVEMFPGQAHIILVASPERCEQWRDVLAQRLIQSDLRKLKYNLELANSYNLEYGEIEDRLNNVGDQAKTADFEVIHSAKSTLTDLIYQAPDIAGPRSQIIQASSAICGCDGALCRLMEMGKKEIAAELGQQVIPLAAGITALRLRLKRGEGANLHEDSQKLGKQALSLLTAIRNEYNT